MIDALRAHRLGRLVGAVSAGIVVVLLAMLVPSNPSLAIGVGVLALAAGLILAAPALLLTAVFATSFAYWRVGPTSLNMSLGDAVTVLALVAAAPFVPWRNRALRQVLLGLAFYLGLLLVTVVATPTSRAMIEWLHRALLFGGAVLIGAAVAQCRQVTTALRAVVFTAAIVSIGAVVDTLTHGFNAAYPFGMNKNAAGPLLAMVVVLLIVAPKEIELRPSTIRRLRVLMIIGVFATQSRSAGLGLVAVIAIDALRNRRARQRAPIFFLGLALALIVVSVVTLQSESANNPKFNSVALRTSTIDDALNNVWAVHPLVGGGLKYFQQQFSQSGGAEQIFVAELAEAGVLGLVGLLVLLANTLRVLLRRRGPIGEAALLVFILEFLYALTAIFWIAGTLTLPMLMVGLAIGTEGAESEHSGEGAHSSATP